MKSPTPPSPWQHPGMTGSRTDDLAAEVASRATDLGWSVGAAESLTSGAVASALGAAPGASAWFRGGVVAYASEVKFDVLDVPEGPVVSREAALAMARGAVEHLGADIVVSVTGAGGPQGQDGEEPGTVWFGLVWPDGEEARQLHLPGDPADVVSRATSHALDLLRTALEAASRARA